MELEALANMMLTNSSVNTLARINASFKNAVRSIRTTTPNNQWDYKNIIDKLQVGLNDFFIQLHYHLREGPVDFTCLTISLLFQEFSV